MANSMSNHFRGQAASQITIPKDITDYPDITCLRCKCTVFMQGFSIKKIPPIVSGASIPILYQTPVPVCVSCGTPYIVGKEGKADESLVKEKN